MKRSPKLSLARTAAGGLILATAVVGALPSTGRAQAAGPIWPGLEVRSLPSVSGGIHALLGAGIDSLIHGRTTIYRAAGGR